MQLVEVVIICSGRSNNSLNHYGWSVPTIGNVSNSDCLQPSGYLVDIRGFLYNWRKALTDREKELGNHTRALEPISTNIYKAGDALDPSTDKDIFLGRTDLINRLNFIISTSRKMPMLFI